MRSGTIPAPTIMFPPAGLDAKNATKENSDSAKSGVMFAEHATIQFRENRSYFLRDKIMKGKTYSLDPPIILHFSS